MNSINFSANDKFPVVCRTNVATFSTIGYLDSVNDQKYFKFINLFENSKEFYKGEEEIYNLILNTMKFNNLFKKFDNEVYEHYFKFYGASNIIIDYNPDFFNLQNNFKMLASYLYMQAATFYSNKNDFQIEDFNKKIYYYKTIEEKDLVDMKEKFPKFRFCNFEFVTIKDIPSVISDLIESKLEIANMDLDRNCL